MGRLYLLAGALGISLLLASFALSLTELPTSGWSAGSLRGPISEWLLGAGLALVTVIATSHLVERQSQKRIEESRESLDRLYQALLIDLKNTSEGMVKESCGSVGRLVFGDNYSTKIIDATLNTVFKSALVRRNYKYHICLSPGPTEQSISIVETYSYIVRNESILDQVFEARIGFEDASTLYGTGVGYKPDRLTAARVGATEFTTKDIARVNKNVRSSRPNGDIGGRYLDLGDHKIPPKSEVFFFATVEAVEAAMGQWVSVVAYPVDGLEIEVINSVERLQVHILPIGEFEFGAPTYPVPNLQGRWVRTYEGVLLTNSGWNIRWGSPEYAIVRS